MAWALPQSECFGVERKGKRDQEEEEGVRRNVSGFLKTSRVTIYFRSTDSLLPFHTGSGVFLQGQKNQGEKERSGSKMKAVRLDAQLKLCKMPALADSISFKNVLFRIYYY